MMSGMGAGLTMGLMSLIPLLVLALLVWVVLQVSRNPASAATPPEQASAPVSHPNPAFAILAERYARGEITREEFLERRRDLQELGG